MYWKMKKNQLVFGVSWVLAFFNICRNGFFVGEMAFCYFPRWSELNRDKKPKKLHFFSLAFHLALSLEMP